MANETSEGQPVSNRQVVLQAILDLAAANRQASRKAICDVTGLRMPIVDDHVRNLKEDELIRQVVPGIFEPIDQTPDRPVSGTIVPHGAYKLEIGDHVLELTLREAKNIALLTSGLLNLGR